LGGIYGYITYKGVAKGSITVALRRWNTQTHEDVSIKSATSNSAGRYLFTNVPTLGADQVYYVRFGRNSNYTNYVSNWWGPEIETYTSGHTAHGGNMDIADIDQQSPTPGSTATLPARFTWLNRNTPDENYELWLFDPDTGDAWYWYNLGDTDNLTITALPPEIVAGKDYAWYLRVYTVKGSYGESFAAWQVFFNLPAAAAGRIDPRLPSPATSSPIWRADKLADRLATQSAPQHVITHR
jgi:hypothetical protein